MMDKVKVLQIFDFDETIVRVPSYTSNKHIDIQHGFDFETPYEFYDHPISLCEDSHNIQAIGPVFDAWKAGENREDYLSIVITHRVSELEKEVREILENRGMKFENIYLLGRKSDKTTTALELMRKLPNLVEVKVFEDSIEQIQKYHQVFESLNEDPVKFYGIPVCTLSTYIVDKSKMFKIENIKLSEEQRIKLL